MGDVERNGIHDELIREEREKRGNSLREGLEALGLDRRQAEVCGSFLSGFSETFMKVSAGGDEVKARLTVAEASLEIRFTREGMDFSYQKEGMGRIEIHHPRPLARAVLSFGAFVLKDGEGGAIGIRKGGRGVRISAGPELRVLSDLDFGSWDRT